MGRDKASVGPDLDEIAIRPICVWSESSLVLPPPKCREGTYARKAKASARPAPLAPLRLGRACAFFHFSLVAVGRVAAARTCRILAYTHPHIYYKNFTAATRYTLRGLVAWWRNGRLERPQLGKPTARIESPLQACRHAGHMQVAFPDL